MLNLKRTGYIATENWAGKTKARKSKTILGGIKNKINWACKGPPENEKSDILKMNLNSRNFMLTPWTGRNFGTLLKKLFIKTRKCLPLAISTSYEPSYRKEH